MSVIATVVSAPVMRREPYNDEECFFISPIGEDGSSVRARSDRIMKLLVEPVAKRLELRALRADQIDRQGGIDSQSIVHAAYAGAAVADLTGGNANVLYQLGMPPSPRSSPSS